MSSTAKKTLLCSLPCPCSSRKQPVRGLEENILFDRGGEGCRVHRRTRFQTGDFLDTTISGSLNVSLSAETNFFIFIDAWLHDSWLPKNTPTHASNFSWHPKDNFRRTLFVTGTSLFFSQSDPLWAFLFLLGPSQLYSFYLRSVTFLCEWQVK